MRIYMFNQKENVTPKVLFCKYIWTYQNISVIRHKCLIVVHQKPSVFISWIQDVIIYIDTCLQVIRIQSIPLKWQQAKRLTYCTLLMRVCLGRLIAARKLYVFIHKAIHIETISLMPFSIYALNPLFHKHLLLYWILKQGLVRRDLKDALTVVDFYCS